MVNSQWSTRFNSRRPASLRARLCSTRIDSGSRSTNRPSVHRTHMAEVTNITTHTSSVGERCRLIKMLSTSSSCHGPAAGSMTCVSQSKLYRSNLVCTIMRLRYSAQKCVPSFQVHISSQDHELQSGAAGSTPVAGVACLKSRSGAMWGCTTVTRNAACCSERESPIISLFALVNNLAMKSSQRTLGNKSQID